MCACAHSLKIGPQSRRSAQCAPVALWQILLWHIRRFFRNGHCARRRVSEANRGNAPALRPEMTVPYRILYSGESLFNAYPTRRGTHCAPTVVRGMMW